MEENLFPLSRAAADDAQLEEERRLAYVGITRAKQKLFITNAYSRLLYGRTTSNIPSRFIDEISPELIQQPAGQTLSTTANRDGALPFARRTQQATATTFAGRQRQSSVASTPTRTTSSMTTNNPGTGADKAAWTIGDAVSHKKWGVGHVVKVSGTGEDQELDIAFPDQGIKRLLAAFAPIQKVN